MSAQTMPELSPFMAAGGALSLVGVAFMVTYLGHALGTGSSAPMLGGIVCFVSATFYFIAARRRTAVKGEPHSRKEVA